MNGIALSSSYLLITEMQFCRCLDQHLSLRLSEADYDFLVSKYGDREKGTVNYRAFCKAMEDGGYNRSMCSPASVALYEFSYKCSGVCSSLLLVAFDPKILDGKPEKQIEAFQK